MLDSLALLSNDTDPESPILAVTLGTGSTKGLLVLNVDGIFAYRPNAGFTGADIFTYVLFEGERLRANEATGTQAIWHHRDRTIQHWPSIQARTLKLLPG